MERGSLTKFTERYDIELNHDRIDFHDLKAYGRCERPPMS
jgi:hypothetical protein